MSTEDHRNEEASKDVDTEIAAKPTKAKPKKKATKDSTVEMSSDLHGLFVFLSERRINGFVHTHHGNYIPGVGVISRTTMSGPTGISESSVLLPIAKIVNRSATFVIVKA